MTINQEQYRSLYRIRRFEETVMENFPKGVFGGTTHAYLGQEANAVGVLSHLQPGDVVFSNHRCHGHYLAYGGDPRALFAEMMGRSTGVCGGRGGSQHLQWRNFYSNGVQGGIVPVAAGMALAEKRKRSGSIVVCFLGDGTLGEGVVYEVFNMAALWDLPVFFVVENNQIAQTTPVEIALAGKMIDRFTAFGIPAVEIDSADVVEIQTASGLLAAEVRGLRAPRGLILHTRRFGPHSKGDDTRDPTEVARYKQARDPLKIQGSRIDLADRTRIEGEVNTEIIAAFEQASADPRPQTGGLVPGPSGESVPAVTAQLGQDRTVLQSLNESLHGLIAADERVILLGEDLLDPYGGAFKVSRGLSTAYPERVIPTPISEAGMVGLAAGMALRGLRPIVEIMFGDFLTLAADQLINHVAKFRWMYNDQVRVPLVVRTPMGGRRGYGPTHSQTLEKLFLGVPGIKVLAPCALGDPGDLLRAAVRDDDPVLFIENKLLYLSRVQDSGSLTEFELTPIFPAQSTPAYRLAVRGAPPPVMTLVAYGYMAELARQAALQLAYELEIFAEVIVLTQLSPFILDPVLDSVAHSHRILAIEEGTLALGWGAEVITRAAEHLGGSLVAARRVAALDLPVPAASVLEQAVLPGVAEILAAANQLAGRMD